MGPKKKKEQDQDSVSGNRKGKVQISKFAVLTGLLWKIQGNIRWRLGVSLYQLFSPEEFFERKIRVSPQKEGKHQPKVNELTWSHFHISASNYYTRKIIIG